MNTPVAAFVATIFPLSPLTLFERWLRQACDAKLADPTAMVVATVDENGQPYQRIVLLKHYDEKGLVFYTNWVVAKHIKSKKSPYQPAVSGICWSGR